MTDAQRSEALRRLAVPIFRQACWELYSTAQLAFESDSEAVRAIAVIILGRVGDLLFKNASLVDWSNDSQEPGLLLELCFKASEATDEELRAESIQ